jgi:hypothetical protein
MRVGLNQVIITPGRNLAAFLLLEEPSPLACQNLPQEQLCVFLSPNQIANVKTFFYFLQASRRKVKQFVCPCGPALRWQVVSNHCQVPVKIDAEAAFLQFLVRGQQYFRIT